MLQQQLKCQSAAMCQLAPRSLPASGAWLLQLPCTALACSFRPPFACGPNRADTERLAGPQPLAALGGSGRLALRQLGLAHRRLDAVQDGAGVEELFLRRVPAAEFLIHAPKVGGRQVCKERKQALDDQIVE